MPPQVPDKTAAFPQGKLFWPVLAALAAGQLLAFWMLCSHQVRKAEVRDATLQVQRVAVADCLRYIPRATLNGCLTRVDPNGRPDSGHVMTAADKQSQPATAGRSAMNAAATPVGLSYR